MALLAILLALETKRSLYKITHELFKDILSKKYKI